MDLEFRDDEATAVAELLLEPIADERAEDRQVRVAAAKARIKKTKNDVLGLVARKSKK